MPLTQSPSDSAVLALFLEQPGGEPEMLAQDGY